MLSHSIEALTPTLLIYKVIITCMGSLSTNTYYLINLTTSAISIRLNKLIIIVAILFIILIQQGTFYTWIQKIIKLLITDKPFKRRILIYL